MATTANIGSFSDTSSNSLPWESVLRFCVAADGARAAMASTILRRAAAAANAWWCADLSQGRAETPLPVEAASHAGPMAPYPAFVYSNRFVGLALTPARRRAAALPGCDCPGGRCGEACACRALNPSGGVATGTLAVECHAECPCECLDPHSGPWPLRKRPRSSRGHPNATAAAGDAVAADAAGKLLATTTRPAVAVAAAMAEATKGRGGSCPHRPSQRLGRLPLVVTRRDPRAGFGLACRLPLAAGSPVAEYGGEVIGSPEASKRQRRRDGGGDGGSDCGNGGGGNFILTVHEVFAGMTMRSHVDASRWGSAGRFLNHSCDPNCAVRTVRRGSRLPDLVFWALRDIPALEELTIDYGAGGSGRGSGGGPRAEAPGDHGPPPRRIPCRCGAAACRGVLPFDPC